MTNSNELIAERTIQDIDVPLFLQNFKLIRNIINFSDFKTYIRLEILNGKSEITIYDILECIKKACEPYKSKTPIKRCKKCQGTIFLTRETNKVGPFNFIINECANCGFIEKMPQFKYNKDGSLNINIDELEKYNSDNNSRKD